MKAFLSVYSPNNKNYNDTNFQCKTPFYAMVGNRQTFAVDNILVLLILYNIIYFYLVLIILIKS